MVFSDLFFLFAFIPAFVLLYLLARLIDKQFGEKWGHTHMARNVALTIFSLLFYAWGEPMYVFLMLVCVLLNYVSGLGIGRSKNNKRLWLVIGVALDLSILCTFKYLGFFAESLQSLGIPVSVPKIALPIGISFYIFQSISYLVDVYRGVAPVQKSYGGLLLYISMFPQLIAGPIVRYDTVAREIHERHVNSEDIADGVFRFMLGLAKKVIIANQMGEIATRMLGGDLGELSVWGAWLGIAAFGLQIYFDFSGYSDMAIGIGRCLGFHFNENFNHPFCANSITDFWRRWHISLGSFFRDYVYIPLGGNRRHQLFNILAVWFLTGLWHGAAWNFVLWGLYFGLILLVEKYTVLRIRDKVPLPLMHFYTLFVVAMGFAVFYFPDTSKMVEWFRIGFGASGHEMLSFADQNVVFEKFWLWMAAIILAMPVRGMVSRWADRTLEVGSSRHSMVVAISRSALSVIILLASVALLIGATNNAFLYTRF